MSEGWTSKANLLIAAVGVVFAGLALIPVFWPQSDCSPLLRDLSDVREDITETVGRISDLEATILQSENRIADIDHQMDRLAQYQRELAVVARMYELVDLLEGAVRRFGSGDNESWGAPLVQSQLRAYLLEGGWPEGVEAALSERRRFAGATSYRAETHYREFDSVPANRHAIEGLIAELRRAAAGGGPQMRRFQRLGTDGGLGDPERYRVEIALLQNERLALTQLLSQARDELPRTLRQLERFQRVESRLFSEISQIGCAPASAEVTL